MSNNDEVAQLHNLIEQKENLSRDQKTELHEQLKAAGTDPNVLKEIREALAPTPRDKSEEITDGDREPEHLGEHTLETLTQEVMSLANTKPAFRNDKWMKRHDAILNTIEKDFKKNPRGYQGLKNKLHAILQGEL